MKKKKIIKRILMLLFVLLIAVIVFFGVRIIFFYSDLSQVAESMLWEDKVSSFEDLEADFERIIDVAYREFEKNPKDEYCFCIGVDFILDYEKEPSLNIDLTENEQESVRKVYGSFSLGGGGAIQALWVSKERATFVTENGVYALIYSKDGLPPTYVNSPNEEGESQFEKINDNWYHAAFKSKL